MSVQIPEIAEPQLRAAAAEIAAAGARVRSLAGGLRGEDWGTRPEPERWSIAEHILHLSLTSAAFLPLLRRALAGARREGLTGTGPFRRDFCGWLLCRLVEPPVHLRTRTPAHLVPTTLVPPAAALRELDRLQTGLTGLLREADGLALDRIEVPSPLDPRLSYNGYSCLCLLLAHQRRHLWLAERVLSC